MQGSQDVSPPVLRWSAKWKRAPPSRPHCRAGPTLEKVESVRGGRGGWEAGREHGERGSDEESRSEIQRGNQA